MSSRNWINTFISSSFQYGSWQKTKKQKGHYGVSVLKTLRCLCASATGRFALLFIVCWTNNMQNTLQTFMIESKFCCSPECALSQLFTPPSTSQNTRRALVTLQLPASLRGTVNLSTKLSVTNDLECVCVIRKLST